MDNPRAGGWRGGRPAPYGSWRRGVDDALARSPSVRVTPLPGPLDVTRSDPVSVGRLRRDPGSERGLAMFVSGDNLRKCAARNAVQIAEALLPQLG
jgi:aspartate-semialdehyde dehydrogenase